MRKILIIALLGLLCASAPVAASDAFGWVVVDDTSGAGLEVHKVVGNLGVLLSSIQEQRPSPSPAVSEEPLEARQRTFAAFYERDLDPSFSVGIGIARLEYSVTGVLSEEEPPLLAAVSPAAEPKKVAVDIEKDSEISPIATVRFATSSGQLFADGQAMLSQAGVLWMGRVGVEMGSVRAGVGYLSSPGDPPIGGPVAFLGASF